MNTDFDRLLMDTVRLAGLLSTNLKEIQKMGPNEPYNGSLKMLGTYVGVLQITLEHMEQSHAPLYFANKTHPGQFRIRPDETAPVPQSILEMAQAVQDADY